MRLSFPLCPLCSALVWNGWVGTLPIRAILEGPESPMPDPTHLYAPKDCADPTQVCEKCRCVYTLEHFQHGVEGQDCVCRRCLQVMGYKV